MPKINLSDAEYIEYLEFRGKKHDSPDKVLQGIITRIVSEIDLTESTLLEFAKRVEMQPQHLRMILSKDKPSDPKFTTLVKVLNGLNIKLRMEKTKEV